MIASEASPVRFRDELPKRADVVIIGAGVIGTSTAWFLRQAGLDVLVCEKGRVAGEQSSRNWGWVRQQGRDAAELPIMIDSIGIWERLAAELGEDIGFERHGVAYLARSDAEMAAHERWLEIARQHQLDTRVLSAAEADALVGAPPGTWRGALFTPSDGRAEPWQAVPAIAGGLQRAGGRVREACAVRALERSAGRVSGVITESGRVDCDAVVCAGGAWSSLFLGNLGIDLPQLTVRATVARTAAVPSFYEGAAAGGDIAFRRRQDGGYTIAPGGILEHLLGADSFRYYRVFQPALVQARRTLRVRLGGDFLRRMLPRRHWAEDAVTPFERQRVLNPAPSRYALARMREGLRRWVPALADVPFEEAWAGMIDTTPDVVPVMDEIPAWPGLFVATGFSGHGFGIGPGAGRVMAERVQGRSVPYDLARFRFTRFSDGSKIEPGPGL